MPSTGGAGARSAIHAPSLRRQLQREHGVGPSVEDVGGQLCSRAGGAAAELPLSLSQLGLHGLGTMGGELALVGEHGGGIEGG